MLRTSPVFAAMFASYCLRRVDLVPAISARALTAHQHRLCVFTLYLARMLAAAASAKQSRLSI